MARDRLGPVRDLAARLSAREAADPESFPVATFADLKASAIHAGPLPPPLGGHGWTLVEATRAVEMLAGASAAAALLVSMPMGLAGIYASPVRPPPASRAQWHDQVEAVAGAYRRGEWYAACNSERGAGGSLAATKTVAVRGPDGTFQITGDKILASAGKYADRFFSTAKVDPADLPGCGIVEFFFVDTRAAGVEILADWDGFGMRSTESQTVRYTGAPVEALMGFPNFIELVRPLQYFFCLFAAIPLGCAGAILRALATPTPESPALRLRFAEATMRYEALRAYLHETASQWRPAADAAYPARVLRTKTYVTQEATKLCAELFALSGGRHYSRKSVVARAFADSFAGTALRPPLPLALDALIENFSLGAAGEA